MKIKREDYVRDANFPIVDQSKAFIAGYTDDLDSLLPRAEYVVFGEHTRAVKYVDFEFAQGADGLKILCPVVGLLPRFLYFVVSNLDVPSRGYNRHWPILKDLRVPVPPLEVQREIVGILDKFTQLEAELEAELEARRLQDGHYRDALLAFSGSETVSRVIFGEAAVIVRGGSPRPIQAYFTDADDGINWIKIGDVPPGGKFITRTAQRIKPEGAVKSRRVEPGDFVLSNSMSFGRPYIMKIDGCIHDGWLAIKEFSETFNPDFLYHLLRSTPVYREMSMRASSGTVQNLNADIVKSLILPAPPLDEQRRIVDILDTFDTLVNDIAVGLPAELAARRQQFEHYRDRLLTFQEVVA